MHSKISILLLSVAVISGCATTAGRKPAGLGKPMVTQYQLSQLLNQETLPPMNASQPGTYVYNDVWCPNPNNVAGARQHLANFEAPNMKYNVIDEKLVEVIVPSLQSSEGDDCFIHFMGGYSVHDSVITFSALTAVAVSGTTCSSQVALQQRKYSSSDMISVYDKQRDKYFLLRSISPLGEFNYCGSYKDGYDKRGYQVYELVPVF